MKKRISHLHCHSEYSILKGVGNIQSWYEAAEKRGIKAIAFTEYGNFGSAFSSYLTSLNSKTKCIFGIQIFTVSDLKTSVKEEPIVLLAKNEEGLKNLFILNRLSWTTGLDIARQLPRVDYVQLDAYKTNVVALSGSLSGPVGVAAGIGLNHVVDRSFHQLYEIYKDNLIGEIQLNELENQRYLNESVIKLCTEYKLRCVITNDCHFIDKGDNKLANVMSDMASHRVNKGKREYSVSTQKWLKSYKQLEFARKHLHNYISQTEFDKYIENANDIANECCFDLPVGQHRLPKYDYKTHLRYNKEIKSNLDLFNKIIDDGFQDKIVGNSSRAENIDEYADRLEFERKAIIEANFVDYFLIVEDIIYWAKHNGVEVGKARGSVAGSLIAFCMDITDIDPLQFDLLFERFLNPARVSGERAKSADALPDIDLDFERTRRNDVKQYIIDKYGADKVCTIGSYQTMKVRSLIRDLYRVFDGRLPVDENDFATADEFEIDRLSKELEYNKIEKLSDAMENELFLKFYRKFPYFVDYYCKKLEKQIKAVSRHAAGILITPTNMNDWIPVRTQKVSEGVAEDDIYDGKQEESRVIVSQWEDEFCERRGLLKLDVLGIKTLDIFKYARQLIKKRHNVIVSDKDIDLFDKKVLDKFAKGETEGVFQFNSRLQSSYLRQLGSIEFEDLITTNALLRPGPMDAKAHEEYILLKNGEIRPTYDHPVLKKYLEKTLGLYIFQENVMMCANVLGNLSLAEADMMRTAIKKKDTSKIEAFEGKFIEGCVAHGLEEDQGREVWKKLIAFSTYGFNRCVCGNTSILLASGEQKKIATLYNDFIENKEIILVSFDLAKGEFVENRVKEVYNNRKRNVYHLKLKNGIELRATTKHGIATERGFRYIKDLMWNDNVFFLSNPRKRVISLSAIDNESHYVDTVFERTFDIEMEGEPRNYFANNILVHNSHSASYAYLGYYCQWLKVHYPIEFWTAALEYASSDVKKPENIYSFRKPILKSGIGISNPLAIRSNNRFHITKKESIAWPIRAVKGVGEKSAHEIARVCREQKPETFKEFFEKVPKRLVNKRVFEKLIGANAFRNFGKVYQIIKEYYSELRKEKIPDIFKIRKDEVFKWEVVRSSILGYMEMSYKEKYAHWFSKKVSSIKDLEDTEDGEFIIVGGKLTRIFDYQASKGVIKFYTVSDVDGDFTAVLFDNFYKNMKNRLPEVGDIIEILGIKAVSKRGEAEVVLKNNHCQLEVYCGQ